ncbi:ead/Ea22-like family protein [Phytobacter ursingii]
MKQVTMESVKQRISELTYTGVQSLRGEFELACLRELVAVTEQRDALVAENTSQKNFISQSCYSYGGDGSDVCDSYIDAESSPFYPKTPATSAAIAALQAEARKEGAIFAANRMLAAWDAGFVEDTPESASDIARAILSMTEFMDDAPAGDFDRSFADDMLKAIARQLRESKGEVSNG